MKIRKIYAFMAAAAMCGSLITGFGGVSAAAAEDEVTVESLLNHHFESVEEIKSSSYKMAFDMDMDMNVFGSYSLFNMSAEIDVQTFGDDAYVSGTMTNKSVQDGEEMVDEMEIESYAIFDGEQYAVYTYDKATDSWSMNITDNPDYLLDVMPVLTNGDYTLEEEGDQYVVHGSVDIFEAISALPDTFSGLLDSFTQMGEISGNVDITYTFNKETQELTSLKIDMAQVMKDIMAQAMEEMSAALAELYSSSESEEEFDIATLFSTNINSLAIEIKDIVYNQGSEIILPDEAKNAVTVDGSDDDDAGIWNTGATGSDVSGTGTSGSGVSGSGVSGTGVSGSGVSGSGVSGTGASVSGAAGSGVSAQDNAGTQSSSSQSTGSSGFATLPKG